MSWVKDATEAPTTPRVTRSTLSGRDVVQWPADLLKQARETYPDITLEEYTLARILASEHFSGTPVELACIGDADCNKAQRNGHTLFRHATGGSGRYGQQGGARPVATARDPGPRHVAVAYALLRRRAFGVLEAPARGIARGALRYFDPKAQRAMNLKWQRGETDRRHCPPDVILKRWTYDLAWGTQPCTLGTRRGSGQQEWVGPIAGVNAYRLMLFRSATGDQDERYAQALEVIRSSGERQPPPPTFDPMLGLIIAAAALSAASHLV